MTVAEVRQAAGGLCFWTGGGLLLVLLWRHICVGSLLRRASALLVAAYSMHADADKIEKLRRLLSQVTGLRDRQAPSAWAALVIGGLWPVSVIVITVSTWRWSRGLAVLERVLLDQMVEPRKAADQ